MVRKKTLYFCLCLFICSVANAAPEVSPAQNLQALDLDLISVLRQPELVRREDVTSKLLPLLLPADKVKNFSYTELSRYYEGILRQLANSYPSGVIRPAPRAVLQEFSGQLKLKWLGTHRLPFVFVSPEVFDPRYLKIYRLAIGEAAQEIPGLLVETRMHPYYRGLFPQDFLELQYVQSLNARAAGFRAAQLMLPLSKNVEVAPTYYYNGFLPWSGHPRHGGAEQAEHAIELTTFAHPAGPNYVLSAEPDFSLKFLRYDREDVLLTFFLWQIQTTAKKPDFVFQIKFASK